MSDRQMDAHQKQAQVENIRFLLDVAELHPDQVARRLGITRESLNKILERSKGKGSAKPDTQSQSETRQGS